MDLATRYGNIDDDDGDDNNNMFYFCPQVEVKEADTSQQRSSRAQVTINVIDTNNNPPVFTLPAYYYSIPEGNYAGSPRTLGDVSKLTLSQASIYFTTTHTWSL